IPLGGNRTSVPRWYFNLIVVFLVSGLWHGANYTFLAWGLLHGLYLVASISTQKVRSRIVAATGLRSVPRLHAALQRLITFSLVNLWRAPIWIRWATYEVVLMAILFLGRFGTEQFIYFQF